MRVLWAVEGTSATLAPAGGRHALTSEVASTPDVQMPQTQLLSDLTAGQVRRLSPGLRCTLRDGGFDAAWVRRCSSGRCAGQRLGRGLCWIFASSRSWTVLASVIVQAGINARRVGRRLVLVRGRSRVDRVLTLTGASDVLELVDLDPVKPPVQALVQPAHQNRAARVPPDLQQERRRPGHGQRSTVKNAVDSVPGTVTSAPRRPRCQEASH